MAKLTKRADGRYQRSITLTNGKRKVLYGHSIAELNAAVNDARLADQQGVSVSDQTLVGEWARKWLKSYKSGLRAGTLVMYRNAYNVHIMQYLGGMKLRDVKPVNVREVMQGCAELSESMQHKILLTMQQIFKTAVQNGLIIKNPAEGISITPHKRPEKIKWLSSQQQLQLMDNVSDPRARLFCALGLYAGLRREEILGLQWGDISDDSLTINRASAFVSSNQPDSVQDLKTKAAHRTVPITAKLRVELDSAPRTGLYLMTNSTGLQMTQSGFKRMWEKVANAVDFRVTPHMLRHTFATSLYHAGVDVRTAQYLLGHSSIQMTADVYTHIGKADASGIVPALNAYFSGNAPAADAHG